MNQPAPAYTTHQIAKALDISDGYLLDTLRQDGLITQSAPHQGHLLTEKGQRFGLQIQIRPHRTKPGKTFGSIYFNPKAALKLIRMGQPQTTNKTKRA